MSAEKTVKISEKHLLKVKKQKLKTGVSITRFIESAIDEKLSNDAPKKFSNPINDPRLSK